MVNCLLRRLSRARPPPMGAYRTPVCAQTPRQLFGSCRFSDYYALFDGYNQKRRWPSTTGSD
jgi:hypothetical protein